MTHSVSRRNFDPYFNLHNLNKKERLCEKEKIKRSMQEATSCHPAITKRQFLLLHGDTFIKDSPFEGGLFFENISCWENYISLWGSPEKKEIFIDPQLSPSQIDSLRKEYENLKEMKGLISVFSKTESKVINILDFIQKCLRERKQCALPIHIKGKNNNPGHVLLCMFTKGEQEDVIYCHLLDKGEGSTLHPITDISGEKIKRSYRFPTLKFNSQFLDPQSQSAISWMSRLLKYGIQEPSIEQPHYQAEEIYAYFLSVANQPSSESPNFQTAVTSQRSGTCSMQALTLLFLFDLEMNHSQESPALLEKKKRTLFALRYYSLLNALNAFSKDNSFKTDAQLRSQFRMAIQGLSLTCEKLYPSVLSDHELFLCCCLAEFAEERLQEIEASIPLDEQAFTFDSSFPTTFPYQERIQPVSYQDSGPGPTGNKIYTPSIDRSIDFTQSIVPSEDLLGFLQQSKEDLDERRLSISEHQFVYQLFCWLPCPSHQEDDYWDKIPKSDISPCISLLKHLVFKALIDKNQKKGLNAVFITYIGYAAIHKLCMRLPDLKCEGWGMVTSFDVLEKNCNFFTATGGERTRYEQLKNYFTEIKQDKGELFGYLKEGQDKRGGYVGIFEFDLYVRNFAEGQPTSTIPKNFKGILTYLKEFTKVIKQKGWAYSSTPQLYALTWKGGLNQEFYTLQYMACLAGLEAPQYAIAELNHDFFIADNGRVRYTLSWFNRSADTSDFLSDRCASTHPDIDWSQLASESKDGRGCENNLAVDTLQEKRRDYRYPGHEIWQSKVVFREIRRLHERKNASVALPAALNWMVEHPGLLHLPPIQMEIKKLLLSHRNSDFLIAAQPHLIKKMRAVLKKSAQRCFNDPAKALSGLFWLKLSYEIETQLLCFANSDREECLSNIEYLQKRVGELLVEEEGKDNLYQIYLLKIYLYSHVEKMSDQVLAELMSNWLSARLMEENIQSSIKRGGEYLLSQANGVIHKWIVQIERICEANLRLKSESLQPLVRYYLFPNDGIIEWEGRFPYYHYQGKGIDIRRTLFLDKLSDCFLVYDGALHSIQKNDEKNIQELVKFSDTPDNPKVFFRKFPTVFYKQRPFELVSNNIQSTWHVDGENSRYEKMESPPISLPQAIFKERSVWQSETLDNRHLIVVDKDYKPCFKIEIDEEKKEFVVKKLDRQSRSTDEKLCSIQEIQQLPLQYPFLHIEDCLIWEKGGKITSVEYQMLGLIFHADSGRLFCSSFPNYFLAGQTSKHHCPFPIIVLEKKKKIGSENNEERLFLIPNKYYKEKGEKKGSPYFTYSEDRMTQHLTSSSSAAMIYLICQFAQSGDYEKGQLYLKQLHPQKIYPAKLWKMINDLIKNDQGANPQRSAFYLHLALHLAENEDLMTKDFFEGQEENKPLFWRTIATHYSFILSVLNRVSYSSSISFKQRKSLILKLYQKVPSVFEELPNLKIEYQRIVEKQELSLDPASMWVESLLSYHLPELSQTTWDHLKRPVGDEKTDLLFDCDEEECEPNLICNSNLLFDCKEGECERNFIRLPEKIKDHFFAYYKYFMWLKDPIVKKLDILALSIYLKGQSNKEGQENVQLATLLILVASFPEQFPVYGQISDVSWWDNRHANRVHLFFNSIIDCAKKIDTTQWKISFKELFTPKYAQQILYPPPLPRPVEPKKTGPLVERAFQGGDAPLKELCNRFYSENQISRPENFVLKEPSNLTPLAKKTLEQLQRGHCKNNERPLLFYDFKGQETTTLCQEINRQIEEDKNALIDLQAQIENLANEGFDATDTITMGQLNRSLKENLRYYGKKREWLTLHNQLYEAFLFQDRKLLQIQNPALSDDKVEHIFTVMRSYMLAASRLDQAKEARRLIEKLAENSEEGSEIHQEIATILSKQRAYNPEYAPMLLLFEYASGIILRPEQIDIIKWISTEKESNRRTELLLEFQAGGGKTKVLATLLSFMAIQEGRLPVFFSLPSLADITKKDLRDSFSKILHKKMRFLEISIHTKLTVSHLQHLSNQLEKWRKKGILLYVTPETLHALDLQFKWACATESEHEKMIPLKEILYFFKTKTIFLIDEPHRNACSTETANIATGEAESLKREEKEIFLICYQVLTGTYKTSKNHSEPVTPDGRSISEILKLHENAQALISAENLESILTTLGSFLAKHPLLAVAENRQDEVAKYLCQKELALPKGVNKNNALFLARGLITEVLRPTLRMIHGFDYGPSIRIGDEIESPRFQKNPSLAQFENTDISGALCCQGLYQRGLNQKQMKVLLLKMIEEYQMSEALSYNPDSSPNGHKFARWQKELQCGTLLSLSYVNPEDPIQIGDLTHRIGKHPEVISTYLADHLLPQIKIFSTTFQSTAADLVSSGAVSILFSATLGLQEEYPDTTTPSDLIEGKTSVGFRDDAAFQAAVIQRACDIPNQKILTLTPRSRQTREARDLFDHILAPQGIDQISGFIDLGGWNQDCSASDIAEAFLDVVFDKRLNYDGVIYIRDNTHSLSEKKEMVLILQDKDKSRRHIPLKGSNIPQALLQCEIKNHEKLKLLKICAADQYTGTDFYFESNAQIAITIDQTTTLWSLIQAIMRARQFLKPLKDLKSSHRQRIIWILPTALRKKIEETYPNITAETIFMWALEQETDQNHMEQRIIAAAFQGIQQVFTGWLWEKIFQAQSKEEILQLYKQHQILFNRTLFRDLETLYAHPNTAENTDTVLRDFAHGVCSKANIDFNQWQLSSEHQKIEKIVNRTAQIIPTLTQKSTSVGTVHTHQVQRTQAKTLEHTTITVDISERRQPAAPKDYASNTHAIGSRRLNNPKGVDDPFIISSNKYFDTHLFYEHFYLLHNSIKTYEDNQNFQLKPINFVLLVVEKNGDQETKYVYACSNSDASTYYSQLRGPSPLQCTYQCALITTAGIIAANGEGSLKIGEEWLYEHEEWLINILTQVAFCNGQVNNGEALQSQIEVWKSNGPELAKLWNLVQMRQLNSEAIQRQLIESLIPMELLNSIPEETDHSALPSPNLEESVLADFIATCSMELLNSSPEETDHSALPSPNLEESVNSALA